MSISEPSLREAVKMKSVNSSKQVFELRVFIGKDKVAELARALGTHGSPEETVEAALDAFNSLTEGVRLSRKTLRDIEGRAGLSRPIRSERELLAAFEKVTGLDSYSVVIHYDPSMIPQILATAEAQKISLGEAFKQYHENALALGWYNERIDTKALIFQPSEWQALRSLLGVERVLDAGHLLSLIHKLKGEVGKASAAPALESKLESDSVGV
jgi:hypothetical protein